MSEHGFHAHGPHDHALEHEAHAEPQGMAGHLVVATAIIATVGALFSYVGGLKQVNAGLFKNEAAIKKTEAANQWAYYQAKNHRQNSAEIAIDLVPEARKDHYRGEAVRYKTEKVDIQRKAEGLEKEAARVERTQRQRDPRAPSLGPGHDRPAGGDRRRRDRPAHPQQAPAVGRLRAGLDRRPARRPGLDARLTTAVRHRAASSGQRMGLARRDRLAAQAAFALLLP